MTDTNFEMTATNYRTLVADDPTGMYAPWFAQMAAVYDAVDASGIDAAEGLTLGEQVANLRDRLHAATVELDRVARRIAAAAHADGVVGII